MTSILLATLLLFSPQVGKGDAQSAGDWSRVESLPAGSNVRVELVAGGTVPGELQSVAGGHVVVRVNGQRETIDARRVQRVWLQTKPSHRLRNAGIGMAVGTAVGLGLAAAAYDHRGSFNEGAAAYTAPLGWLGAISGALTPGDKWEVIYSRAISSGSRQ